MKNTPPETPESSDSSDSSELSKESLAETPEDSSDVPPERSGRTLKSTFKLSRNKPDSSSREPSRFSRGKSDRAPRDPARFSRGKSDRAPREPARFSRGNSNRTPRTSSRFTQDRSDKPTYKQPTQESKQPLSETFSPATKKYAQLKHEKGRLKYSKFLIEGVKLLKEIITISPDILEKVFLDFNFQDDEFLALVKKKRISYTKIDAHEIEYLSDTQSNQGVVAVARFSNLKPNWASCRYVSLLDGVQDPGNIGAMFRTSLALGMDAVISGKGSCEIYNPKVVRSSAGAFLRIPFETNVDLSAKILFLRQKGFTILATSPHASYTISQVKLRKKVALIVSNEGLGLNQELSTSADHIIRIPLKENVESLNVAVAHGILSYELINGRE